MTDPTDEVIGKTRCKCGAAWVGTLRHGLSEQRSHAEFHAQIGLGFDHDPGAATFTPDKSPSEAATDREAYIRSCVKANPGGFTSDFRFLLDRLDAERARPAADTLAALRKALDTVEANIAALDGWGYAGRAVAPLRAALAAAPTPDEENE